MLLIRSFPLSKQMTVIEDEGWNKEDANVPQKYLGNARFILSFFVTIIVKKLSLRPQAVHDDIKHCRKQHSNPVDDGAAEHLQVAVCWCLY